MDRDLIKSLIDALAASDLSELEYTAEGVTLRLVKQGAGDNPRPTAAAAPVVAATVVPMPDPVEPPPLEQGLVCAPLYGVVHLKPSPDAADFVTLGQPVHAGQALCVIEAMKTFTELRAETSGTIAAVLVTSGQEVEAGQPLFRLA